jgi:hypothetical protein
MPIVIGFILYIIKASQSVFIANYMWYATWLVVLYVVYTIKIVVVYYSILSYVL